MMLENSLLKLKLDHETINKARKSYNFLEVKNDQNQIIKVILCSENTLRPKDQDKGIISTDFTLDDNVKAVYIFAEDLVLSDKVKAKNLIMSVKHLSTPSNVFDVSGKVGNNAPLIGGGNGGDGQDGGKLFLYVENIDPQLKDNTYFNIDARGGDGGQGNEDKGGKGGKGGVGGVIEMFASYPYALRGADLTTIYQERDLGRKKLLIENFLKAQTSQPAISSAVEKLSAATKTTDITKINSCLDELYNKLSSIEATYSHNQKVYMHMEGGARGIGADLGRNGSEGKMQLTLIPTSKIPVLAVHPLHCAMLLNKAQLKYMFLDRTNTKSQEEVYELFSRLHVNTKPFTESLTESVKGWEQESKITNVLENIEFFQAVHNETARHLGNLAQGIDYFGYTNNYVPLLDLLYMKETFLTPLFANFTEVDKAYKEYSQAEQDIHGKQQKAEIIYNKLMQQLKSASMQESVLGSAMEKSAQVIDAYPEVLSQKKARVTNALKQYIEQVKQHFDFDIQNLLSSLEKVAFTPLQFNDMGAFHALGEGLKESTTTLFNAEDYVTDINGKSVRKDFLIHKLTKISNNLKDLSEGYTIDDDHSITLDDPKASKLLVEQTGLEQNLDDFFNKFPKATEELSRSLQDYVNTIIARNTEILNYNNCVMLGIKNHQAMANMQQQCVDIQDKLQIASADQSAIFDKFVSDAYYSLREDILHVINLTEKAYRLYTLEEKNIFTNDLPSGEFGDINETASNYITAQLITKILDYKIIHPTIPNTFYGVHYTINKPEQLEQIKKYGQLTVKIDPDSQEFHDHPEAEDLTRWKEVRISTIYPYIKGAQSKDPGSNNLFISIRHGEQDIFIRTDGSKTELTHMPVPSSFEYNVQNGAVITKAAFLFPGEYGANLPILGPFTEWHLRIEDHDKIDLRGVTSVDLVFDGVHYD